MIDTALSLRQFQQAAKNCTEVFKTQQASKLAVAIETLIRTGDAFIDQYPNLALLLVNSNDKSLNLLESILLKQVLTTRLFSAKLSLLPKAATSVTRASLYILYWLTPGLIALKNKRITSSAYQQYKNQAIIKAFKIAYHLKLADKEAIKLLSQIAGKNKYSSTNQLLQTLVLLAINSNLSANLRLQDKGKTFVHALSEQLNCSNRHLSFPCPYMVNYLPQLQHLASDSLFAGNLIFVAKRGYFLALGQSSDLDSWYCVSFNPETKKLTGDLIRIAYYTISQVIPQFRIEYDQLWHLYATHKSQWPIELNHFVSDGYYDPKALRYAVPEFWPKATKALLQGNINQLSQAINGRGEFRDILLSYASDANRSKMAIKDTKHAVSLLGLDRVFPVIATGMMKLVEQSYRFSGSDELNNKVDFLSRLALKLSSVHAKAALPEYHVLIVRLLALSLFTIPKVAFSASSVQPHQVKVILPSLDHVSLAEIYQYPKVNLWLQVISHMIDVWQLPNVIKNFIQKYLSSLTSSKAVKYTEIEQEWLNMIQHCNLVLLFSLNYPLDDGITAKITRYAKKIGYKQPAQLQQDAKALALELNLKTSLV